ncbi:dTDP-4-dehydrorhamnose 3,5-epimerase [Ventosimonas gracilis]|uniref:dTDP-4-dehydrorhamnose 3,5-epimerase n=1 Tax=Ventosimonas gracilis TaxID=1680762 RepID=A0A139SNN1_9GAMM|nr:dTDP-4-dehydrorhamnose 3,5-epimerase [Ventosimonas gracilis]KXU36166.1 dTDP-4-dehydrorhamnose 3,5-epimerase [Ventosimonas gracilis]
MKVIQTRLPGVLIIEPRVFRDERGFFLESFEQQRYRQIGIEKPFVQDNLSRSSHQVLRGLHFQRRRPQGKLVSVSYGRIWDVAVDIEPTSPHFTQYVAVELSDTNHRQLWLAPGYAHGFCVLSAWADVHYRCTDFYCAEDESGVCWNDTILAIDWPIKQPILSQRDKHLPSLTDYLKNQ